MNKKDYNKLREEIYNLSLFCGELNKIDDNLTLIKEEAIKIIKEKSLEIEEGLKGMIENDNIK